MTKSQRIAVVGCGIIGLTSAIQLSKSGYSVDVIAREFSPNTTSDVAAAFWYPYHVHPRDRVLMWSLETFKFIAEQGKDDSFAVSKVKLRQIFHTSTPDPWLKDYVIGFQRTNKKDLPTGFNDGFEFETYIMQVPVYMAKLKNICEELNVNFKEEEVLDLGLLSDSYTTIVNCTGVWAKYLVKDNEVFPIRGQIASIERPEKMEDTIVVFEDGEFPAYIVPRSNDCLLGGTAQFNNWDLLPDQKTTIDIQKRCIELNPLVSNMEISSVKVGLRPGRSAVRLELEKLPNGIVIHNYGHGGAGFTLAWGCADEVVKILEN